MSSAVGWRLDVENKKLPVIHRQSKGGFATSSPGGARQHKEG